MRVCLWAVLGAFCLLSVVEVDSFYLPGVIPHDYQDGERGERLLKRGRLPLGGKYLPPPTPQADETLCPSQCRSR